MVLPQIKPHSYVIMQLYKNGMSEAVPIAFKNVIEWKLITIKDITFIYIMKNNKTFNLIKFNDILELEVLEGHEL